MHTLLAQLVADLAFTGSIASDAPAFLVLHGHPATAQHSAGVAAEAGRIAALVQVDVVAAQQAGWLHDISAVFASPERARVADVLGVEVLEEERAYPPILHQKLSAVLARELFGVSDGGVLSAIACHTTLRAGATDLDKVVFLADKIAWDQPGEPPYLAELLAALSSPTCGAPGSARLLDAAALVYLNYLWQRRDTLPVVHPWMCDARQELCKGILSCP